jgi:hypothetical protein
MSVKPSDLYSRVAKACNASRVDVKNACMLLMYSGFQPYSISIYHQCVAQVKMGIAMGYIKTLPKENK